MQHKAEEEKKIKIELSQFVSMERNQFKMYAFYHCTFNSKRIKLATFELRTIFAMNRFRLDKKIWRRMRSISIISQITNFCWSFELRKRATKTWKWEEDTSNKKKINVKLVLHLNVSKAWIETYIVFRTPNADRIYVYAQKILLVKCTI